MRGLLASIVTLGLCASPALAGGPTTPRKVVLDHWDAAYLKGAAAGHVHTYTEAFEQDGQKLLRTTVELRLRLKRFSDLIELAMDTGNWETPEGKVAVVFMRQYLGKTKRTEITGTVVGDQLKLTLDGNQPMIPAPWNDAVVSLAKQQSLFKDRKIGPGDKFDYLSFEPTVNLVVNNHVEVKDWESVELYANKKKVKLLRVEIKPDRIEKVQLPALVVWLNEDLQQVRSQVEVPGLGDVFLYRTTREHALSPGSLAQLDDVGISQLVRLSSRINRPFDTTAAVYRVKIRDDAEPGSAFARDDRQSVKNVQGNTLELHVRASHGPTGMGEVEKPGVDATQSSYFITSADDRVKELARQAVGTERDSWRKALRVEKWVNTHMTSRNHEALATADHVARTLEGDCTEYAMLTAAMCRAEGVPSRTAVGLVYADVRGQPSFAFHMWTEVWVQGEWLPIDATLGRGGVGATHLKICDQTWHDTRTMTPLFPVVRVLGRINIDVLRVEGQ